MIDLSQAPCFSFNHLIDALLVPIRAQADIRTVIFSRRFLNQEKIIIATNKDTTLDYFAKEFYRYGLFEKDSKIYQSGFHMWDHLLFDPNGIYRYMRTKHSVAHGLTIVQQHGDYCDFFVFTSAPNNPQINNFYLNHKDLFTRFIADFYNSIAPEMPELLRHKIFVPANTCQSKHDLITLSPRQEECAHLMLDGLTTKEIARSLNLSPRTVQEYIDLMKVKFDARNRLHLQTLLQKYL